MNKIYTSTRDFIRRNKNTIIVGAITTTVIAIQQRSVQMHNDFLKEKGLYDEYYTPEIGE